VHRIAQLTADNIVSIGSSLSHVHVPGRDKTEEALGEDEVEIGMGIHNEQGSEKSKEDLSGLVKKMLKRMLDQSDKDRGFIQIASSDQTVLLVNNLGGVSVLELGGIANEVIEQLSKDYGIKPARILAGTYMTSLNGLGFSITLLKVQETGLGSGKSILELLDAPAEAPGWSAAVSTKTWDAKSTAERNEAAGEADVDKPSNLASK
jgi:triose/dihydroxyacetone kinase / FAD-AMP lyase (cyclizing)